MKKRIVILGSTGSIGVNAIDVLLRFPDEFTIVGLAAKTSIDSLAEQVNLVDPEFAFIRDPENERVLKHAKKSGKLNVFSGPEGILEMIRESHPDMVVNSLVGGAGLLPTVEALNIGAELALANKESLVMAGELVIKMAKKNNTVIRPIDSEHSALWQCLAGEKDDSVQRLILTASGGPFRKRSMKSFKDIKPEDALKHPNWEMGKKITIDSSTMFNKGLEIIEARWLFDIVQEKIDVTVHPQSIVHSMVEYCDGSIKAQLSYPDMRLPIQYALTYPQRKPEISIDVMDFSRRHQLTFEPLNNRKFPAVNLARQSLQYGATYPAVLNAANETAVQLFLDYKIKYTEITALVSCVLNAHSSVSSPEMEDIIHADIWARDFVNKKRKTLCSSH